MMRLRCCARVLALAGVLLAGVGAAARAQVPDDAPPWIQVEALVFRHLDSTLAGDETWPAHPEPAYPDDLLILRERDDPSLQPLLPVPEDVPAPEHPFVRLGPGERTLDEAAARIAASPAYRLLGQYAWRQPMPARGTRASVLIVGGEPFAEHFELEGSLTVARTRFLHIDTRLWLNDFTPSGDGAAGSAADLPAVPRPVAAALEPDSIEKIATAAVRSAHTVVLEQTRRARVGETHYIDHPLFALLLRITPFDPEASPDPAEQDPGAAPDQSVSPAP